MDGHNRNYLRIFEFVLQCQSYFMREETVFEDADAAQTLDNADEFFIIDWQLSDRELNEEEDCSKTPLARNQAIGIALLLDQLRRI